MAVKKTTAVFFICLLLLIGGCSYGKGFFTKEPSQAELKKMNFCQTDSDCVCGGTDRTTGRCFLGSKEYYEKYVDSSKECPDFCSGIEGNLVVKCGIDNRCFQSYQCMKDIECEEGKRCLGNKCVEGENAQNSEQNSEDTGKECVKDDDCKRAGCSAQLCVPKTENPMSTCEYKDEYACLEKANCRCFEGWCEWEENKEYSDCVNQII
jgi:eight-cysteine-cluster-containing protein